MKIANGIEKAPFYVDVNCNKVKRYKN